ncbi:MAG: adenine-specific methyltransferase EcoRI family protein [Coriobacteriales bacterium]|jgi:hypothetical protein|nr:adenine-specific methyltransferase EcoRI family protein [Coriobacteriales bacterium]
MANKNLTSAKNAKNDEFYTQYEDIQKEVNAYLEFDPDVFRGKTILLPCDDPYESNFFKLFASRFNQFGLKKLIATSYAGSLIVGRQLALSGLEPPPAKNGKGKGYVIELTQVSDVDGNGIEDINDVRAFLEANPPSELRGTEEYPPGDFRSPEVLKLRDEADLIITNPPFSLFREFLSWVNPLEKKFLIIGNKNAITYKEVFPLIKDNRLWTGATGFNKDMLFTTPAEAAFNGLPPTAIRVVDGKKYRRSPSVWFTNLDHGRRHQPLQLMTMEDNLRYNDHKGKVAYAHYDNYDAIEVPFTDAIPSDYNDVMGVPISFLDKYNPEQFEILGATQRGCHDLVPDTKKYNDFWEMRQNGERTGSSGNKTNENANLRQNDGHKNYFINAKGDVIQSAYQRIFIKWKEASK